MRIALVSQEFPPAAHGGLGTQTQAKAHGMAERGHEVHVVTHSVDRQWHDESEGLIHVSRVPGTDSRLTIFTEPAQWVDHSTGVAAALASLHERHPFDLIDFAEWGCEGYVYLLNRTEWNYVPVVIQLHGPLVMLAETIGWPARDSEFYRVGVHMEGTCLRLADAVFSSSQRSAAWCAQQYELDASRIPVLHTGIDTDHFRPLDVEKASCPTVVFVGKAVQNKGIEVLAEAVCRLASNFEVRLQLIGRGHEQVFQRVQQLFQASGHAELLETTGFVERSRLPEYLSRAHVFAAPSFYEGGPGFVYLEAMACGLPAIACEGSGAAEVIAPGKTGFLVPPHDVDALTNVLADLLSNDARRCEMGQCARDYVVKNARSQDCLDRLEAFYAEVATRQPRRES